ncbi:MAG: alpha/beta fold hydrolase [Actinomycetota bacterium]
MWREGEVEAGGTRFLVRGLGGFDPLEPQQLDDGELIVLLHGWPEDGSSFERVAPLLVAAGYRVACPDLKGFGRSDVPRRGYDPATLADEMSQLIQALGARKAILVGHDFGGAVALSTAFRHPGRVEALVIASSPFRQIDLIASWHIPLLNLPVVPEITFRLVGRPLTRAVIRYAAQHQEVFDEAALDRYADAVTAVPRGWLAYYRTLSRRAVCDIGVRRLRRLLPLVGDPEGPHRLRVPVAVVWGEQDRVTPYRLGIGVARDLDAVLVPLPGVGHFVHEEAPEAFASAILELAGSGADRDATSRWPSG